MPVWLLNMGRCAALLLVVCLPSIAPSRATAAEAASRTQWMETRLGGTPTGFLRESVGAAEAGWRTEVESKLVLSRMESRVEIRTLARYDEDADGQLQSLSAEVGSSVESTAMAGHVREGVLHLRSSAGGRDYETQTPLAQPLLGPQGIRRLSAQRLRAPGDRIEYATFAGEFSSIAKVVREVTGSEMLTVAGKPKATVLVRETLDVMPVPTLYWMDADGRPLRSRQESPFGTVDNVLADAAVQARVAKGAALPDETYQNAVAKSNIRLPRPRSLSAMRVRIDLKREDATMPVLDGPSQTVIEHGARHAVVEMQRGDVPASARATGSTAADTEDEAQWLVANPWLQSDHPDVLALARSLQRQGLDRYAQARVLQDWVATHMAFDAGIALVSASEAVRDRRGTCMAYAVVLTSLARALEIPSRVVMGYIYAANMWGGHAWTEVLIDGRWVALDAAVWRDGPADPARIGVIRTSLEQGMASGIASLSQLYGNERVRVLEYTLDGRTVAVPDDAVPYAVQGRDYRNRWVGAAFRAPESFTFAEVDIMYPRSDIAVLRNAAGAELVIEQRALRPGEADEPADVLRARGLLPATASATAASVAGRAAWTVDHDEGVAAVWVDDSDLWLVHGQGAGAGAGLRDLLATFELAPTADAGVPR